MPTRPADLARLQEGPFDLLVIGGGITGAGVARDAAMRGVRTALVEADDFGAGTSSRSSRLVHGGVRYLEHGYFGLVFEASRERRTLLRIAPHLVRPLRFTWPVYKGARVPRWKLAAGLLLYDVLALFRNVGTHRPLSKGAVLAAEPALRAEGLQGGAAYWDAETDDARLTLANALAARDAGATVCNHVAVRELLRAGGDGPVVGARVEDRLGGRLFDVRARVVVNAAGPWADEIQRMEDHARPQAVRGTKGVHLLVPAGKVGNRSAVTLLHPVDGRVMFVLPARQFTLVGTTDTATTAHPGSVRATEEDVLYLLRAVNGFFPEARLTRKDVISAWAGIRPLIAAGNTGDAASASREHAIHTSPAGLVTVSGGKLTTYRSMAAEVVDTVETRLGRKRTASTTDDVPLPGGDLADLETAVREAARLCGGEELARHLVRRHGSRWRDVWGIVERRPELGRPVHEGLPYLGAEIVWAVQVEQAATLADILVRRTNLAYELPDAARLLAPAVAALVAPVLGWTDAGIAHALREYALEAERLFAVETPRAAVPA